MFVSLYLSRLRDAMLTLIFSGRSSGLEGPSERKHQKKSFPIEHCPRTFFSFHIKVRSEMSTSLWMSADSDISSSKRYPEVAEIEVNFLVENFSGSVRKDFDEMLRMVVLGTKGHCFRVLAFTIKRLSGDNTQSARAAMDGIEGRSMFGSGGEGNLLGKMVDLNSG